MSIEAQISRYVAGLDRAVTYEALIEHLEAWAWIAPDALEAAPHETEFSKFRAGLELERSGVFSGDEWARRYMPVLIPEEMLHRSMGAA